MKRENLTGTYNADGYMVYYRGKFVYGAGVKLPREKPLHWRHAKANREENKKIVDLIISNILRGDFKSKIEAIDDLLNNAK